MSNKTGAWKCLFNTDSVHDNNDNNKTLVAKQYGVYTLTNIENIAPILGDLHFSNIASIL